MAFPVEGRCSGSAYDANSDLVDHPVDDLTNASNSGDASHSFTSTIGTSVNIDREKDKSTGTPLGSDATDCQKEKIQRQTNSGNDTNSYHLDYGLPGQTHLQETVQPIETAQSSSRIPPTLLTTTPTYSDSTKPAILGNGSRLAVATATVLASAAAAYTNEVRKQQILTAPPLLYGQCDGNGTPHGMGQDSVASEIVGRMLQKRRETVASISTAATVALAPSTSTTANTASILTRPLKPRLFVGTRSTVASVHAYLSSGPAVSDDHYRFTEVLHMPSDGALVALDWELPPVSMFVASKPSVEPASLASSILTTSTTSETLQEQQEQQVLQGKIAQPLVLILHGINNHAGFGYMRSLMRECCNRGWLAVGFNFRGCGDSASIRTPRLYNAAYTGDIRSVVHILSVRLKLHQQPLFMVGNSLGANLLVKYLGEEGLSETLPCCVAGAVTMANPMAIDSRAMNPLVSAVIAQGAKENVWKLSHLTRAMQQTQAPLTSSHFRQCIRNAWRAVTLEDLDAASAPIFCRNEANYPYAYKVGYESALEYWKDASSFRLTPMVSIPLLQLVARDDFLARSPFFRKMAYNVNNPNIMVLETMSGGHLGWQEEIVSRGTGQWADAAMAEFIQAALDIYQEKHTHHCANTKNTKAACEIRKLQSNDIVNHSTHLRSRL